MVSTLQSYVKSKDAERKELEEKLAEFLSKGGFIKPEPIRVGPPFKKKLEDIYFGKQAK
jgi:hypothetical protein